MASRPEDNTSILPNVYLETQQHHNRLYQSYALDNLAYLAPMDEDETERLDISHDLLRRVFDGRLIFPPITRPRRILDCGYGTGIWAAEIAEQFPRCEVIGVDINPMQANEVPANLYLQVDDLNDGITFPAHNFDLVNSQMMASSIHANRWPGYLRDIYRVTRPGGWCQMVEMYLQVQSDNGSLTDAHALRHWSTLYAQSLDGLKDLRAPIRLSNRMRDASFVDVETRMIRIPTCVVNRLVG